MKKTKRRKYSDNAKHTSANHLIVFGKTPTTIHHVGIESGEAMALALSNRILTFHPSNTEQEFRVSPEVLQLPSTLTRQQQCELLDQASETLKDWYGKHVVDIILMIQQDHSSGALVRMW